MRIVESLDDGAVVHLTEEELRLLAVVLIEIESGVNAFPAADWDMMLGFPREAATSLKDDLLQALQPLNEEQG